MSAPACAISLAVPCHVLSDDNEWTARLVLHHLGCCTASLVAALYGRAGSVGGICGRLGGIPCDMSRSVQALVSIQAVQEVFVVLEGCCGTAR